VLREGEFTNLDDKVTLHIRRREAGAALSGILIDDHRNKTEDIVYTAERGQVVKTDEGTFLVLENGAMQRKADGAEDTNVVVFKRYAFDLSPLADDAADVSYRPRERYMAELWSATEKNRSKRRRIRAQLHERLSNPLYPFAFMAIAFAALARPRTTRQSSFIGIIVAVILIFVVRLSGVGIVNIIKIDGWATPLLYAVPLVAGVIALAYAFDLHAGALRWFGRFSRRVSPA
jgi:lipopolysaccharide export system permease protein